MNQTFVPAAPGTVALQFRLDARTGEVETRRLPIVAWHVSCHNEDSSDYASYADPVLPTGAIGEPYEEILCLELPDGVLFEFGSGEFTTEAAVCARLPEHVERAKLVQYLEARGGHRA
jgi:hypothetical protein